jgi:hypothetical protein
MMPHVMGVLGRHVAVGDGSIVPGRRRNGERGPRSDW